MSNAPIDVEFYDAWTRPRIDVGFEPGLDRVTYLQVSPSFNYAGDFDNRAIGEDAFTSQFNHLRIDQWPGKMPGRMWLDYDSVNSGNAGGPTFKMYVRDWFGKNHPLPTPLAKVALGHSVIDRSQTVGGAIPHHETISERNHNSGGPAWIRVNTPNRDGGTWLDRPFIGRWHGFSGSRFSLEVEDNELFVPFDLTKEGRYSVWSADGQASIAPDASTFLDFHPGSKYRVYLRPQMWWFDVNILLHYIIVTPFAAVVTDEILPYEGAMRPPVWPYRHDLLGTRTTTDVPNFFGAMFSSDYGISNGFDNSRVGVGLREAVYEKEFRTISMAKIFIQNELPWCTIWTDTPEQGSIIAAIDEVDKVSGKTSRVLLRQNGNLNSIYPDRIIGSYLLDFTV